MLAAFTQMKSKKQILKTRSDQRDKEEEQNTENTTHTKITATKKKLSLWEC